MAEYMNRSRGSAIAYGGGAAHAEPTRPPPTPAEIAGEAAVTLERDAEALERAVEAVRGALAANDRDGWTEARARLDAALRDAGRSRARANERRGDAAAVARARLAAAERRLDELEAEARVLAGAGAPLGYRRVAREAQIEAALAAPIEGPVAAGYHRKEALLRAELARLPSADSRVLAERLRRARPEDPIAALFGRMTAERRGRLLAFLDDARRREALRGARGPAAVQPGADAVAPASEAAPGGGAPAASLSEGTAPGGELPYRAEMEAAFGEDFSAVRSRVGAARPLAELGAIAAARGEEVAFASATPDRAEVAHELAHVVQRRRRGGAAATGPAEPAAEPVAEPADTAIEPADSPAEREAEEVAAAVAAGRRAPAIEQRLTGSVARAIPQRGAASKEPAAVDAARWLRHFHDELRIDVHRQLTPVRFATGHPRLLWNGDAGRLAYLVWREVTSKPRSFASYLGVLLAPLDLAARVDAMRPLDDAARKAGPRTGPLAYVPEVAIAIARELERGLAASMRRLGPRLVAAVDATHDPRVGAPGLRDASFAGLHAVVTSHPMDAAAVVEIGRGSVATVRPREEGEVEPALDRSAAAGRAGLRPVTYRWAGDPAMWNWIRTEPADATPEEVAQAVLGTTRRAHELRGSAPFFALPRDAVRALGPTRVRHVFDRVHAGRAAIFDVLDELAFGASERQLAASGLGEEAGLAQAARRAAEAEAPAPRAGREPLDLAARCRSQIDLLVERFPELDVRGTLAPTAARLAARTKRVPALSAEDAARFGVLFEEQSAVLYLVAGELDRLLARGRRLPAATATPGGAASAAGAASAGSPAIDPEILELAGDLLEAGAVSDLPETARARLAAALEKQRALAFDTFDAMLDDARARTLSTEAISAKWGPTGAGPRDAGMDFAGLRARQAQLAADVLAARRAQDAGTARPGDTQLLGERVRALQVEARLVAAMTQCDYMADKLNEEEGLVATLSGQQGDLQRARNGLRALYNEMGGVLFRWREQNAALFAQAGAGAGGGQADPAAALRAAIAGLEEELARLGDERTQRALEIAHAELRDVAVARMVVDVAVMVGLTLVTSGFGAAAAGAARGLRLGRLAAAVADISTQSVAMAGLRALIHGDAFASAVRSELATSFAGFAALRGVAHGLARLGVGARLATLKGSDTAWRYVAHGAELTVEAVTQAGVQFAIAQAQSLIANGRALNDHELKQLAIQGMGMFLGNAIAHRLAAPALDQIAAYAARVGASYRRAEVRRLAAEVGRTGDPAQTSQLLRGERELIREEQALLERIARDPAERRLVGEQTLATLRAQSARHGEEVGAMAVEHALQGGLTEVSPGTAWEGPAVHVERALTQVREAGARVAHRTLADGSVVHHIEIGGRRYTVKERSVAQSSASAQSEAGGKARAQADAITALHAGAATPAQRAHLAAELQRQVPDVALSVAVAEGNARTVIAVVTPGGGATGIKSLNDDLVGHALTDKLLAARDHVVREVFARHGMAVVHTSYKTTTVVSPKPPAELAEALRASLADIGAEMRPRLREVLDQGAAHWATERDGYPPGSKEREAAALRVRNIDALRGRLDADPSLTFGIHLGAAEIAGGRRASYAQILGAEMNANKAAIMARDPALARAGGVDIGDPRGLVYSQAHFVAFARETLAMRDQLAQKALPWNGEARPVITGNGEIDRDLARAARKRKIDPAGLSAEQRETLALLESYMSRVNSLDYLTRTTGDEVGAAGRQVRDAARLVRQLASDQAITKQVADEVARTLANGGVAQAGTASEAQFYNRAASSKDRVVLNADIKDLGLDVLNGNARAIEQIARGGDVDTVSRSASDQIVQLKRRFVEELDAFYRNELLPEARRRVITQDRQELLPLLDLEQRPLLLLGGDELTLSIPRAFEELELVPMVVRHLQTEARSRVAVTRTGTAADGVHGHEQAMKASESGHDVLKAYEVLARDLTSVMERLPHTKQAEAKKLSVLFEGLYTSSDGQGKLAIHDRTGKPVVGLDEQRTKAEQLVKEGVGR